MWHNIQIASLNQNKMQHKKLLVGALTLALLLGGTYAYSEGGSLQGKFGGSSLSTTKSTGKTTSSSTSTATKPDLYFGGAVSYDSGQNAFSVSVCQTNVASTDVKLTSLKFAVARGQSATVQFYPTTTTSATCQTVRSGDLLDTLLISQSGSYDLTATLDTTSVQTEASETNNTVTTSGVVAASGGYPYLYDSANLPDLSVDDMYIEKDGAQYNVLSRVCGLNDLLSYPSGGEVASTFSLYQNGVEIDSEDTANGNYFGSTEDCGYYGFSVAPSKASLLQSGTVTMYTQLDVRDNVPESNEDNNGFGQTFTDELVVE